MLCISAIYETGVTMNIGVPSLEFMEFQNDSFFKDLTNAIQRLRQGRVYTAKALNDVGLETIIKDRLKMSIEMNVQETFVENAYAELPLIDKNHPFFTLFAKYIDPKVGKLITNTDMKKIGYVDVENAVVGGVFEDIPVKVALTSGLLRSSKYTNAEIAGILLHELGHVFTYYYYLLHTTIGGFITSAIAAEAAGASSDKERKIIFEKGNRFLGLDNVDVNSLLTQDQKTNADTLSTLYINDTVDNLRSLTGYGMYELKACEQLADAFAARFGASSALATGLYKLHINSTDTRPRAVHLIFSIISALTFLISIFQIPMFSLLGILLIMITSDLTDGIYDNLKDRLKYLKQHVVQGLKDKRITDKVRKDMLKQIDELVIVIDRTHYNPTIFQVVRKIIFSSVRKKYRAHELQKNIEQLIYNDLFVEAARSQGVNK